MAEEGKGIPGWVWIVAALILVGLILRSSVNSAANKATSPSTTKNLGYGIGSGAVDSLGSAAGKFLSGLFGGGSSPHKSDGDAGGPVDISGSVDWDRSPPSDSIADDLEGPSFS